MLYSSSAFLDWIYFKDIFSKIDGSRIYQLHQEICFTQQNLDPIVTYYGKLKQLWDEFEDICALPNCGSELFKAHIDHSNNLKLFQYLIRFNETCSTIRSNLLMRKTLPSLNEAYNSLNQEKSQRGIAGLMTISSNAYLSVHIPPANPIRAFQPLSKNHIPTLLCSPPIINPVPNGTNLYMNDNNKGKKILQHCTLCHMRGHHEGICYKKHGYPRGYVPRKGGNNSQAQAHNAVKMERRPIKMNQSHKHHLRHSLKIKLISSCI